jgi:disulfide bond formation protein DsbB
MISNRLIYLLGFLAVSGMLATGIYLQQVEGVIPCHLCILQRVCFVLMGGFFLIGALVHAKRCGRLLVDFFLAVMSTFGIILASRQVWLQHFHVNDGKECGVSLQYMLQVLPFHEAMQKVFAGSGECAQRGWEFLGLNIAEWSLLCFIGFLSLALLLLLKERSAR